MGTQRAERSEASEASSGCLSKVALECVGAERAKRIEASAVPLGCFFKAALERVGTERLERIEASEAPLRMRFSLQSLRLREDEKQKQLETYHSTFAEGCSLKMKQLLLESVS